MPENELISVFGHFCVFRRKSPALGGDGLGLITMKLLGQKEENMINRNICCVYQASVQTAGQFHHRQGGTFLRYPSQPDCRRLISVSWLFENRAGYAEKSRRLDSNPESRRIHAVFIPQPSSAAVSVAVDPDGEFTSLRGIRTHQVKIKERQISGQ